jgi:anti-sigma-K factor RskA
MNCRRFEHLMWEYLDETLSSRKRASADRHLARCGVCREALRRHQQIARTLSKSLQQTAESLRLDPEVERCLLGNLTAPSAAGADRPFREWFPVLTWRLAAAAVLVCAAGLLVWGLALLPKVTKGPSPSIEPSAFAWAHTAHEEPTRTFEKDGPFVRDCLTYQTVVVNVRLWAQSPPTQGTEIESYEHSN